MRRLADTVVPSRLKPKITPTEVSLRHWSSRQAFEDTGAGWKVPRSDLLLSLGPLGTIPPSDSRRH